MAISEHESANYHAITDAIVSRRSKIKWLLKIHNDNASKYFDSLLSYEFRNELQEYAEEIKELEILLWKFELPLPPEKINPVGYEA